MKCPSKKTWSAYWVEQPDTNLAGHLKECAACRETARGYERIIGQLRAMDCSEPDPAYWPELKRAILQSLPAEPSRSFWQRVRLLWTTPLLRPGLALGMICLALAAYIRWPSMYEPTPLQQENPEQLAAWFAETNESSVLEAASLNWSDDWAWSRTEAAAYFENEISVEEAMEHLDQNDLRTLDREISGRSL